jgi:hypothetical protein
MNLTFERECTGIYQPRCDTIAVKTGEHCPEKPVHFSLSGEKVSLCDKCYKTLSKLRMHKMEEEDKSELFELPNK